MARPLVGGGFEMFKPSVFQSYAPDPTRVVDVHSIYFEVLGEHGFVGLGLLLLMYGFTWLSARRIARSTRTQPHLKSYGDLARMVQVSLVGYAVGGTFLGLAYFDLPYHLVSAIVICRVLLDREMKESPVARGSVTAPGALIGAKPSPAAARTQPR
jgi:probable O-glycosylation ligase (exosortase A-associated)